MNDRDDLNFETQQKLDAYYKYLRQARHKLKQLSTRFNRNVTNLRNQVIELEQNIPEYSDDCREYINTLNKLNISTRSNKMSRIITDMIQTEQQINHLEKEYDDRINTG